MMDNQVMKTDHKTKMKNVRKTLFIVAIALSWVAPLLAGCDTDENENSPVSLKWRYKTGSLGYSSPAVVDDVIYVGDQEDFLYAIDKETGELIWQFYENNAIFSSPSVVDGVIYVGRWSNYSTGKHYLYVMDATSGKLNWRFKLGGPSGLSGSPTVVDGIV
jgi:eukaryotic-like serine/threonine-protein kinase